MVSAMTETITRTRAIVDLTIRRDNALSDLEHARDPKRYDEMGPSVVEYTREAQRRFDHWQAALMLAYVIADYVP